MFQPCALSEISRAAVVTYRVTENIFCIYVYCTYEILKELNDEMENVMFLKIIRERTEEEKLYFVQCIVRIVQCILHV